MRYIILLAAVIVFAVSCTSHNTRRHWTRHAYDKPPVPARPIVRVQAEDDIREAVFRHMFQRNASSLQQGAAAYFLQLGDGQDPSDILIQRFAGHTPPVKKVSQSTVGPQGVVDKETGGRGLLFEIDSIKWLFDTEVEVAGGYYEGNVSSSGNTYTVRLQDGKWMVVEDRMHRIS